MDVPTASRISSLLAPAFEEVVRCVVLENQSSLAASGKDSAAQLRAIHGLLEKLLSADAEKAAAAKAQNEAVIQALTDASARAAVHAANALWAARQQRIQWAMSSLSEAAMCDGRRLIHLHFECLCDNGGMIHQQFSFMCDQLIIILKRFLQGSAATLFDGYSKSVRIRNGIVDDENELKKAEAKKAFHAELVDYLHGLLGERPIISPGQQSGQYVIMLPPL